MDEIFDELGNMYCNVVGAQYENKEGRSRWSRYHRLKDGDKVVLQREHRNRYDPNAIMVYDAKTMIDLGYLSRRKAAALAPLMDQDYDVSAYIRYVEIDRESGRIVHAVVHIYVEIVRPEGWTAPEPEPAPPREPAATKATPIVPPTSPSKKPWWKRFLGL